MVLLKCWPQGRDAAHLNYVSQNILRHFPSFHIMLAAQKIQDKTGTNIRNISPFLTSLLTKVSKGHKRVVSGLTQVMGYICKHIFPEHYLESTPVLLWHSWHQKHAQGQVLSQ